MYTIDPDKRIKNFREVAIGYTREQAAEEVSKAVRSRNRTGECPLGVEIATFVRLLHEGKADEAYRKIKEQNHFPSICGRICPAEKHCERCEDEAHVPIGKLERYAADLANANPNANPGQAKRTDLKRQKPGKKKVAVVGSGPAGLACAATLSSKGYKVTIYEALHRAGGRLAYQIPSFRLPEEIASAEIESAISGAELKKNSLVGSTVSVDELKKDHDAVFIAFGAGTPRFMGLSGEDSVGIYTAAEFLMRVNLMKAHEFPAYRTPILKAQSTVVVGGGEDAVDAARVARRLGSEVTLIYRQSIDDMGARLEEIMHAQEEGVKFLTLTCPSKILGKDGEVKGVECMQMMLGETNALGKRRSMAIEGSEFRIECGQIIVALGHEGNPFASRIDGLSVKEDGSVMIDGNYRTSLKGIFAGGRACRTNSSVIESMSDGKKAALEIDSYLGGPD